jgi:glyceraldehyde 3-phosphate dehydrogenase
VAEWPRVFIKQFLISNINKIIMSPLKKIKKKFPPRASLKIAINGFGRIGRQAFKIAVAKKELEVIAINDLTDTRTLAHLLRYDTVYGKYEQEVKALAGGLVVNSRKYKVFAQKDPSLLPWKKMGIDVVLECTGFFTKREEAALHLKAGAKQVIISAPSKSEDVKTLVMGVNEEDFDPRNEKDRIISCASCTTNSLAPVMKVLCDKFGVKKSIMSTVHSYTADQNLVDGPHKDLRRARAAAQNIVPTTTGAAIAVTKTLPELKNAFDGIALRVPTADVSVSDLTAQLKRKVTIEQVNRAFKNAARQKGLVGILGVTEEPLVSSDFIGNYFSTIVDLSLTKVIDGDLVKVVAWYDNEWGYSCRLVDETVFVGKKLLSK